MTDRRQRAVFLSSQGDGLNCLRAKAYRAKHLIARQDQFDGAI